MCYVCVGVFVMHRLVLDCGHTQALTRMFDFYFLWAGLNIWLIPICLPGRFTPWPLAAF